MLFLIDKGDHTVFQVGGKEEVDYEVSVQDGFGGIEPNISNLIAKLISQHF